MCVRLPVDPVTFLDSYLDSVFILGMLVVWCFTVFTHKHHWVALLRVQKLSLMSWPDLIATSGAHSLIWQYAWEGGTVFRCCSSLAKVSEDSIMSSVYSSRSKDDCFFSAFVKMIWALIMNSILYVQFNRYVLLYMLDLQDPPSEGTAAFHEDCTPNQLMFILFFKSCKQKCNVMSKEVNTNWVCHAPERKNSTVNVVCMIHTLSLLELCDSCRTSNLAFLWFM